jgi:hypothetical protein
MELSKFLNNMNIGLKIKKDALSTYVQREATRNIKLITSIMAVFLVLFFMFTYSYGVHGIIMPPLTMMLIVSVIFIYFVSLTQMKNIASETTFKVTELKVEKIVSAVELNMANKFVQARNEARYGVKANQSFPINQIESTEIKPNEIVIKSYDYNFFNGNGKIIIPKELERFNDVKQLILEDAEKFKIVS